MIKVNTPLVSVAWLYKNLDAENLIILDATIAKVGVKEVLNIDKKTIKNARFFDIKNVFSDKTAAYPNTVLTSEEFQAEAQKLGINKESCIVVYDDKGIYSSPRVWWLFKLMGFNNIAVLNGGFPTWEKADFPVENAQNFSERKGNFEANFQSERIKYTAQVLSAIKNENFLIADARSKGRFNATESEPRKEVRGGHIPNSVSLPYSELIKEIKFKATEEMKEIFKEINPNNKYLIFSCGSGITACILALAAEISENNNYSVYDGSWTEWGSRNELPIIK